MEDNKKYVKRSFWVHQYEKEEVFLSDMARDGWHFVGLHAGIPTKYEFVKGDKIDYVYQLDFVTTEEDTEDYHQLFKDAGWDEVFTWDGAGGKWYYFRKLHSKGQVERIFTDSESKYNMYNKLCKKFGVYFAFSLFLEINAVRCSADAITREGLKSPFGILMLAFGTVFAGAAILFIYFIIAILHKRNAFKSKLKNNL